MRRRFRVDAIEPDSAGTLDPGAAVHRHLCVLRAAPGDVVNLFDGHGVEMQAEVVSIGDRGAVLRIIRQVHSDAESLLDTCLVQAIPARAGRMETIVRQVTEMGVRRIVPVLAQRSQQPKAKATARERNADRWMRIADSAAEQSGRSRVPRIDRPCGLADLPWESLPRPLFIGHATAPQGASAAGREGGLEGTVAADAATVMVGPEGGWTDAEVEAAVAAGALTVHLGPRVMRADTAGVVMITLLQYLWGDLRGGQR